MAKPDTYNRISIPKAFRKQLKGGLKLWEDTNNSLRLASIEEFEKVARNIHNHIPERYEDFMKNAVTVDLDTKHRLLIPPKFHITLGINKEKEVIISFIDYGSYIKLENSGK